MAEMRRQYLAMAKTLNAQRTRVSSPPKAKPQPSVIAEPVRLPSQRPRVPRTVRPIPVFEETPAPVIHRADGEADQDPVRPKLTLDDVINIMAKTPERIRKILMTTLFGTTLGAVMDILMGSPLGISSFILRSLLKLVPGGWLVLGALDGLGYLLAKSKNIFRITNDPGFQAMADQVKQTIPPGIAENLIKAAEQQVGAGNIGVSLVALLNALFLGRRR